MCNEIDEAIRRVASSGEYLFGPQVSAFEQAFAAYCGVRFGIGLANGTDALEIALRAVGCGPGDEVITVANAGMYATTAALAIGARPVLVDIEPHTMTMEPISLARALSSATKAVVVTHLFGRLADMDAISASWAAEASRSSRTAHRRTAPSRAARRPDRLAVLGYVQLLSYAKSWRAR